MLLREDLDLLVLGAREAVYALDLKDISKKHASVSQRSVELSTFEIHLYYSSFIFVFGSVTPPVF